MSVLEVQIVALIPTRAGCAIFLGTEHKLIHFFIDLHIGHSINSALSEKEFERPLTHDVFSDTLMGFGAEMMKMVIHDYENEVYYARMYWVLKGENKQKSIVEIDVRPSDAMALAVRQEAPILISKEVWENAEDMTDLFNELKNETDTEEFD